MKSAIYSVILAGGKSSRLFPFNKVLSDLTGSGKSLIQQVFHRVQDLPPRARYVLTVRDMILPIQRQLKIRKDHVFVDPVRRGTWPAILWAMAHLRREDPTATLAVLTGDHAIQGDRKFTQAFRQAVALAQRQPAIVMLGITPRLDPREWCGYGCFRMERDGRISKFSEKPTLAEAEGMMKDGNWKWNAGMFFFRIATAEAALRRFQPNMYSDYALMVSAIAARHEEKAASIYESFPDKIEHPLDRGRLVDNSIDYAIMTPLVHEGGIDLGAYAVDTHFFWTDLGQWTALRQILKPDRFGNIRIGQVRVGPNVRNSILVADRGHRLEISGVQGMILAISGGKTLVLPEAEVGKIKDIVSGAKSRDRIIGKVPSGATLSLNKRGNVLKFRA